MLLPGVVILTVTLSRVGPLRRGVNFSRGGAAPQSGWRVLQRPETPEREGALSVKVLPSVEVLLRRGVTLSRGVALSRGVVLSRKVTLSGGVTLSRGGVLSAEVLPQ